MRIVVSGVLILAALLCASVAMAQTPSPAQVAFDEGHAAYDRGDYVVACAKFAKSHSLDPGGGTLMSLADCEEHISRFLSARTHYNAALALFSGSDERIPFVEQRLKDLESRIPKLTLRLAPGAPSGTTIELNGFPVLVSELSSPVAMDPGDHKVTASAAGHATRKYEVTLAPGQSAELVVNVGERQVDPAAAPSLTQPSPSGPGPGGQTAGGDTGADYSMAFVVGGITGAAGLVAVALSVRAFTHYGDLAGECAGLPAGCSQGDRDSVEIEALAANVLYGVAGAGAIATLFLTLFAPTHESDTVSLIPERNGVGVRVRF